MAEPRVPLQARKYDLAVARRDVEIPLRRSDVIWVQKLTGTASIRINSPIGDVIELTEGDVYQSMPNGPNGIWYERIYLTNTVQAGAELSIVFGGDSAFVPRPPFSGVVRLNGGIPAGAAHIGTVGVDGAVDVSDRAARQLGQVQVTGSNIPSKLAAARLDSRAFFRLGSLAASTTETLVDLPGIPCELESLALSCDYSMFRVFIYPYLANGTLSTAMGLPQQWGTGLSAAFIPDTLNTYWNGENDFFKNFVFDTANNHYSSGMKRQAVFNNGIKISISNPDAGAAHNASVLAMISTWES